MRKPIAVAIAVWDSGEWCYLHSVDLFESRGEYDEYSIDIPADCFAVEAFISQRVPLLLNSEVRS